MNIAKLFLLLLVFSFLSSHAGVLSQSCNAKINLVSEVEALPSLINNLDLSTKNEFQIVANVFSSNFFGQTKMLQIFLEELQNLNIQDSQDIKKFETNNEILVFDPLPNCKYMNLFYMSDENNNIVLRNQNLWLSLNLFQKSLAIIELLLIKTSKTKSPISIRSLVKDLVENNYLQMNLYDRVEKLKYAGIAFYEYSKLLIQTLNHIKWSSSKTAIQSAFPVAYAELPWVNSNCLANPNFEVMFMHEELASAYAIDECLVYSKNRNFIVVPRTELYSMYDYSITDFYTTTSSLPKWADVQLLSDAPVVKLSLSQDRLYMIYGQEFKIKIRNKFYRTKKAFNIGFMYDDAFPSHFVLDEVLALKTKTLDIKISDEIELDQHQSLVKARISGEDSYVICGQQRILLKSSSLFYYHKSSANYFFTLAEDTLIKLPDSSVSFVPAGDQWSCSLPPVSIHE